MATWRVRIDGFPALIDGDPGSPRGALVEALGRIDGSGTRVWVDGERWNRGDTEPLELQHGAEFATTRGEWVASPQPERGRQPALVVLSGPGAGRLIELPAVVGRDEIGDPLLSAQHFAIGADLTVRDLGSRNGTACDAETLEPGAVVHAGSSLFTVLPLDPDERPTLLGTTATGRIVQRQFREAEPALPEPPPEPRPPGDPADEIGGTWWRALVPVATALGMALVTGRWWFLAIAVLAPIVYAADAVRRGRKRRRDSATVAARYVAEREHYEAVLTACRNAEVRRVRAQYFGGGVAAALAAFGHRRLWERRPGDADFGTVTLGFAPRPSAFQARGHSGDDPVLLAHAPLSVDLMTEGPLGVTGPIARTRAVGRAIVIDLCFAHAPVEVNVWVLTDPAGASEWAFAQWLPHTFSEASGMAPGGRPVAARLATTPAGRAVLVQALRAAIDARREFAGRGGTVLPLHVVVVDGVHTVTASDLADLLSDGPPVGVICIVLDRAVVPEGVRAELRLGRHADECSYRSVLTPPVASVCVAELAADLAHAAARALAPLEARGRAAAGPLGQVHFTELVGLGERTPAEQAELWAACSPCTNVPVGVAADGSVLLVDFVRHGPHGLIGGMTRSGKTEFLKTWFSALALHNHPDDLAIVIVDFKGGVDHQALAALPHVIALATNQDIDLFERTLTLLTAELERRQRLFTDDAGVATLEGYRTARRARPDLAPVPRLLMVVDEFAELLETSEGRAQLGRLESTARIGAGLGVHLLLLTQLFDHALPPTIDAQAGLRVCFKVQHGEHSSAVLKSPAAAAIGAHAKGRGFARFQGGELIEFQAARVGNAARRTTPMAVRRVDVAELALPAQSTDAPEVPNEQQDLHRIVDLVRRAAGPGESAVPWPHDLPDALELDEVPAGALGLADDAAHQRAVPLRHDFTDGVVIYAGSPGSGHHDALVTAAIQLARAHRPDDLHIYGIDALGHGFAELAALPHVGAIATRDDAIALRILEFVTTEAVARRGARTVSPQIVVCVLGLERLFLHGEGSASPLLGPLTALVNEAPGTGIQVVCSGPHAMLANRIGAGAGRRLVFRAHDPLEYPPTVPRPARARLDRPLRCFDSTTGLVAQVARPVLPGDQIAAMGTPVATPPRRFTRMPWPLQIDGVKIDDAKLVDVRPRCDARVPLGVEPDSGDVVWLDPDDDGLAHRIVGPPKSGRSNALAAIGALAATCGWDVLASAASRRSPLLAHAPLAGHLVPVDELVEVVAEGCARPTVVLVDDAHRLDDEFPWRKLLTAESASIVTFVAGATEALSRPLGVMRALNASGGVALMPSRPRDGDAVGVRQLEDGWLVRPLPGVGVAGICGEAHRVQFPLVLAAR